MKNAWLLFVWLILFLSSPAFSEEGKIDIDHTVAEEYAIIISDHEHPEHEMTFKDDGTIEIDGFPIQELSHPEIKEASREIAAAMTKQTENHDMVRLYDRQTTYLLQELEKCQQAIKEVLEILP